MPGRIGCRAAVVSLGEAFVRTARNYPDRRALRDGTAGWWTYSELDCASELVAAQLHAKGVAPGDRVLLLGPTSVPTVASYLGALRVGAIVVPINPAATPPEIAHIVADAQPSLVMVCDRADNTAYSDVAGAASLLRPIVNSTHQPGEPVDVSRKSSDTALLCYTSGTTGEPKAVAHTHNSLLANIQGLRTMWRWRKTDRLSLSLPMFHLHGLAVGIHGTLLTGASAVLHPRFEPEDTVADARDQNVTLLFGVPTMYQRLLTHSDVAQLATLRMCVSGSAPLHPNLRRRWIRAVGPNLIERYGSSEALICLAQSPGIPESIGSVGWPIPGTEVQLSTTAELLVRGPSEFTGYWNRHDLTANVLDSDGWLRTTDVAETHPDGSYSIVGRTADLIISGGENVYPREVENALFSCAGVTDVAVVGRPDSDWGEAVVAYIVLDNNTTLDTVRNEIAKRLMAYKRPKHYVLLNTLPRNHMGKVITSQLPPWQPHD